VLHSATTPPWDGTMIFKLLPDGVHRFDSSHYGYIFTRNSKMEKMNLTAGLDDSPYIKTGVELDLHHVTVPLETA
jgi:hypothetical protein